MPIEKQLKDQDTFIEQSPYTHTHTHTHMHTHTHTQSADKAAIQMLVLFNVC